MHIEIQLKGKAVVCDVQLFNCQAFEHVGMLSVLKQQLRNQLPVKEGRHLASTSAN